MQLYNDVSGSGGGNNKYCGVKAFNNICKKKGKEEEEVDKMEEKEEEVKTKVKRMWEMKARRWLPAVAATPAGNETDLQALLDFKIRIVEDPFNIMSSWNDSIHHCNWLGVSIHHCNWLGVTCNISNGRVIHLSLEHLRLGGTLTPFIGNFTTLAILNLLNNNFHGEFPQTVGRLLYLQHLNFSLNNFGGSIPSNLSHCTRLRVLAAGANNLRGTIPAWIGNLSSLSRISFGLNNFIGGIPHEVGLLSNLTLLVLYGNYLSGTVPSSIYNISSLYYFTFTQNHLHGNLPADVGFTLHNIQVFAGAVNNLTGSVPPSFLNASKLEILDLSLNSLTGTLPKDIGVLHRLTRLSFEQNRLGTGKTDDLRFLDSLVNCTALQVLRLGRNNFGGVMPKSVANFSRQLQIFALSSNRIDGNIPVGIGNLANLTILALEGNRLTGSVPNTLGKLQNLRLLYLNVNKFSESSMYSTQSVLSANLRGSIGYVPPVYEQYFVDENKEFECEERAMKRYCEIEASAKDLVEDCFASLMQIGVSCSANLPSERMPITVVSNKLHAIKKSLEKNKDEA
ncbi:hypothetical protein Fmac_032730 [Flemingia macrophylla]|uniref:Leucine-rich repeat-containing N-terminal plant-type domain-containing protein n=1 Tax=Flemingia macrophylla TaxID=520843 RepID=A0ABD1L5S6_9FABA